MNIEKISYKNSFEMRELNEFLKENALIFDASCDYTVVLRDSNDKIAATVSKTADILKCFAISSSLRGEGVATTLVTHILNKMFEEGYSSSFVFTKSENLDLFLNIGYREVATTDRVSLLEIGVNSIDKTLAEIKEKYEIGTDDKDGNISRSMLIMNCNPFTLGHLYIIERAASESEEVIIFVVEEDKSVFPFNVRFDLVKKGCSHLKNVKVIPGTKYIISSATFPNYFLKKDDDALVEYTKLDVTVAGKRICPAFNIKTRYIGEEPFCPMTSKYNSAIMELFPKFGIDVKIIKRKESGERAISATDVRKIFLAQNFEKLRTLVPQTTYDFLTSAEAFPILEKLKNEVK